MASSTDIKDKEGEAIHAGDTVYTKIRGGGREGEVETVYDKSGGVVEGSGEGVRIDVKHPPKVVFTDQHGHQVSHNPGTLTHPKK
ncbi:hypothetical protein PILCRDRAFT_819708 [Piloderma croceum F 1598]|uniref:Hypervirulence associated protein TUDOR domain-containing protein n=1 Tax=Piloderma croceum (strain F 1598) TaxID=765440 RepID=A0A0C3FYU6_PILCF|nr:hypothetical protein PILCRDRAFT_819708 [Piloderma croceum F 1598]